MEEGADAPSEVHVRLELLFRPHRTTAAMEEGADAPSEFDSCRMTDPRHGGLSPQWRRELTLPRSRCSANSGPYVSSPYVPQWRRELTLPRSRCSQMSSLEESLCLVAAMEEGADAPSEPHPPGQ